MKSAPSCLLLIKSCSNQCYQLEEVSYAYYKMFREQWKNGQVSSDTSKQQNTICGKEENEERKKNMGHKSIVVTYEGDMNITNI